MRHPPHTHTFPTYPPCTTSQEVPWAEELAQVGQLPAPTPPPPSFFMPYSETTLEISLSLACLGSLPSLETGGLVLNPGRN